jgi:hypothetical protein
MVNRFVLKTKKMKKFFILTIALLIMSHNFAQSSYSYSISTNSLWSTKNYPVNSGKPSSFTLSTGVTLSIDQKNITCTDCSFSGGNITISQDFTCQSCSFSNETITMNNVSLTLNSSTNSFTKVNFTVSGTGNITANAALTISNSSFTFNNSAYLFNNGGALNISASTLNFDDNAYLLANAGPVTLSNSSELFIGNGASSSNAYIKMNGPELAINDNSGITLGNNNNYYFNWSSYNSGVSNTSISTSPNTLNCGGSNPNSCKSPLVYGPATLNGSGLGSGSILPVTLTNLSANFSDAAVMVSWSTQQEVNSDYFEVERSQNGSIWTTVGTIAAKGNSSAISDYAFKDVNPLSGVTYYRLKMVDLNNDFSYSEISVVRSTSIQGISFFPNPAQDFVNVSLVQSASSATTIQLMSISGQVLTTKTVSGGNATTVSLQVTQFPRGMYILRVVGDDGSTQTSKLVITH